MKKTLCSVIILVLALTIGLLVTAGSEAADAGIWTDKQDY